MAISTFLRRALLYVPGSSQKMLNKSNNLVVDSVIYDLEDSVTPDSKDLARRLVADHLATIRLGRGPKEVAVRINAVDTGLAQQDISQVVLGGGHNLDTIVVPKVQSPEELRFVADAIRHVSLQRRLFEPPGTNSAQQTPDTIVPKPVHIIALIESAMGLANVLEICHVGRSLGLVGLGFAAEDFMASVGLSKLPDRREVLLARSTIANACRAYNLPSIIDMVSVDVSQNSNSTSLAEECNEGRCLGFTGKQAVHPSQVDIIQRAFGPSDDEIKWAVQVYVGDIESQKKGLGAWKLNGRMVDAPVVKTAMAILDRARMCGMDVDTDIASSRLEASGGRLKGLF
ncbi:Pyruvate/Phosphoenolpyruvate kinase-like domain-containing protein [Fusarium tricinctum]|uniref:Pyruvate/Phosphoenolpyruvate kinase-like domain-containing protein n=1 Tax=Fusarium tricinctum TaxID=61284 RepID=A0A8K0W7Q4_9HYPO|nr:Pyruvate/Phosphoenolpyruvate kinase-like domain-containing protein [Fusarium tricinctum]